MKIQTQAGPYLQLFRQFCWEIDRDIVTAVQQGQEVSKEKLQEYFQRFGAWESIVTEITDCLEDEEYYAQQVYDLEEYKRDNEDKLDNLKDDIADIRSELEGLQENIEPDDAKERYGELLEKLDDIAEGNRPRYKRKKKK